MRFPRQRGSTSVIIRIFIPDNSVSTGAGVTGLTSASTNLAIAYSRELQNGFTQITGANIVTITTIGTWASPGTGKLGFKAVDATNAPGLYEIHFPDDAAAFGTGDASQNVIINILELTTTALKIGPNMCLIPLVPWNYQDGVRMGLTALPNAAAGASGGLPLSVDASGRVDVLKINGTSQTARDIGASVLLSAGTGTGQLDFTSGVVKANLVQILATALTETAGLLAGGFKKFFNVAAPTLTCLGIDQTGDSYARLGTAGAGLTALGDTRIANLDATISSRTKPADTQAAVTTVTNLTNAASAGDFTAAMKTSLNAATPAVTVSDKTGFSLSAAGIQAVWDALTSALITVGGIGKLLVDNINATISSRLASASISLSAGAVTVGTNNDKTGYTASTVSDKTGYALTAGEHTNIAADAQTGLTAQGYTSTRAGYLDTLNGLVQAIWDKATSALTTVGSVGKWVLDKLDVVVSTRLATSGYTAPPSAASVAGAVWDEAIGGHLGAGTTGAALNAAGSAGDPWATALPGAYGAGTAGKIVGDNVNAAISSRLATAGYTAPDNADIVAIKAKTDNLPASPAAVGSAMTLTGAYDPAKTAAQAGDAMALTSGERTTLTSVIWAALTSALTTVGSIGKRLSDFVDVAISSRSSYAGGDTAGTTTLLGRIPGVVQPQTGDAFARLGVPAGASVSADVAAVKSDTAGVKAKTDNLPAAPAAVGDIPTAAANADKLLGRSLAAGADGGRTVQDALRALRNKTDISNGVLTVTKEDDTTVAWTAAVTSETGANPITGIDPA